jgi:hypothetical protein
MSRSLKNINYIKKLAWRLVVFLEGSEDSIPEHSTNATGLLKVW